MARPAKRPKSAPAEACKAAVTSANGDVAVPDAGSLDAVDHVVSGDIGGALEREVERQPESGQKQDPGLLLGEVVLIRSSLWMNGRRTVAAIVTGIEETSFGLGDAIAIVSVTAFPPGSPSRTMGDVPLYAAEPDADVIPAAWPRP